MRLVRAYPPNIDALDAAFQVRRIPGVVFTWGQTIYVPNGRRLSRELIAHEEVHAARQGNLDPTIEKWWENYIADPEFRLAEELPGHVAEYREFCRHVADSNKRAMFLFNTVAKRLCSPLYGGLLTHAEARRKILDAVSVRAPLRSGSGHADK